MKKGLLSLACIASLGLNAQTILDDIIISPNKTTSFNDIVTIENASRHNAMAYDAQKSLFVAGVFDTDFEGLEAIAASSYIIKKNSEFQVEWKVAIKGAATVTSLISDGQGGVYAAGTIADIVEFIGADGQGVEKEGYTESGAYTNSQCASFIAHYDATGKVINVATIIPTVDPALEETFMYYPVDGDVYCKINSLALVNGKLYASAIFSNKISTSDNSSSVTAGYINYFGGYFLYMSNQSAVVIELNDNLEASAFPFILKAADEVYDEQKVNSIVMTSDNSDLYLGVVATGTQYSNSFGNNSEFTFSNDGLGTVGYGHIVFAVSPESKTTKSAHYESATDEMFPINFIKGIKATDESIILAGTFNNALAFDLDKTPVGADDMYVVSLSKNDLNINWTAVTNFDEGEATKNEEIFTAMTVSGDYVYLSGYASDKATHTLATPLSYVLDAKTGDIKAVDNSDYIFGLASAENGNKLAKAHTTAPMTGISFSDFGITSGISDNFADNSVKVSIYPNPVTETLYFTAQCDVEIFTIDGISVLKASDVSSVDVNTLVNGIYFVKTTIEGKSNVVKVIKK